MAPMAKSIAPEIQQTRPFHSLEEQAVVNLLRTCRGLEESWVQYLKQAEGISLSQYHALRILRGAAGRRSRWRNPAPL